MLSLSDFFNREYVNLKSVAKKENIPEKYLENIVSKLKAHELIRVKRGVKGGYMLAYPPEKILLIDIVEALEGSIFPRENMLYSTSLVSYKKNALDNFLEDLKKETVKFLRSRTLEDLTLSGKKAAGLVMFNI